MTIHYPPYSFVKFGESLTNNCTSNNVVCLPISQEEDLVFQVIFSFETEGERDDFATDFVTTNDYQIFLGCNDGGEVSEFSDDNTICECELVNFTDTSLTANYTLKNPDSFGLSLGDCFTFGLFNRSFTLGESNEKEITDVNVVACSPCFVYTDDVCFTTVVEYSCNENTHGFNYNSGYKNRVRLPMYLTEAQFKEEREVYPFSNGTFKKIYEKVNLEVNCIINRLDLSQHNKLKVAFASDSLTIKSEINGTNFNYVNNEPYEILYSRRDLVLNTHKASTKLLVSEPLLLLNSNCD